MKARDLRDRSTEDLVELERSLTGDRFQNKFKNFTNRLDDTSLIRKQKRDLARVKLILTERSRGITVIAKPRDEAAAKAKPRAAKAAEVIAAAPAAAASGTETEAAPKSTKAKAAPKASKAEAKPAAEKKGKAPAADKPTAKKPKAKEETK